jgi:hypothetical protein
LTLTCGAEDEGVGAVFEDFDVWFEQLGVGFAGGVMQEDDAGGFEDEHGGEGAFDAAASVDEDEVEWLRGGEGGEGVLTDAAGDALHFQSPAFGFCDFKLDAFCPGAAVLDAAEMPFGWQGGEDLMSGAAWSPFEDVAGAGLFQPMTEDGDEAMH